MRLSANVLVETGGVVVVLALPLRGFIHNADYIAVSQGFLAWLLRAQRAFVSRRSSVALFGKRSSKRGEVVLVGRSWAALGLGEVLDRGSLLVAMSLHLLLVVGGDGLDQRMLAPVTGRAERAWMGWLRDRVPVARLGAGSGARNKRRHGRWFIKANRAATVVTAVIIEVVIIGLLVSLKGLLEGFMIVEGSGLQQSRRGSLVGFRDWRFQWRVGVHIDRRVHIGQRFIRPVKVDLVTLLKVGIRWAVVDNVDSTVIQLMRGFSQGRVNAATAWSSD